MKKWVIGCLVGGILVFGWQGLSWMVMGMHDSAVKYLPAQDNVMNALNSANMEDGAYMLPNCTPESTKAQKEEFMKGMKGKPWASIIYHKSFDMNVTMSMIRGLLVDIFLVMSLIYILTRGSTPIPRRVFSGSVALGLFTFLWGPYMGHIWYNLPWSMIKADLYDSLIAWALCGLWLGWWLNRKPKTMTA